MRGNFFLPVAILALTVIPTIADRATYDPTKTQIALPMETPPTIDGVIDPAVEWQLAGGANSGGGNFWIITPNPLLADGIRGGQMVGDDPVPINAEDLSFNVYVGFDSANLYIGVRVKDDLLSEDSTTFGSANEDTWDDDSVEVYLDGDNSNFPDRDATGTNPQIVGTGGMFAIAINTAYREAEAGNPGYGPDAAWYAQTLYLQDYTGYDVEFRISLATLGNPKPGDIIGFTVVVNDDDDGGPSERQIIWVGTAHVEATYGNLRLGARTYEAPKLPAPAIDGQINTAEYAGAQEIKVEPHTAIWDSAGDDTFTADDASFSAWAIHDAEAIYVAIDVTDDKLVNDSATAGSEDGSTWEDDSVEIFFDADHDRNVGGQVQPFEGQYVFTANGARRDAEALNPTFGADTDWFAATTQTDHGYQVEFKVMKSALLDPADGATLGFHIALNDDDGAGRKSQPGWSGRAHSEFTYGTLTLGGPLATKPEISIAQTGETVTITFTGSLQAADTITGDFTNVPNAISPYPVPTTGPAKFYRAGQ